MLQCPCCDASLRVTCQLSVEVIYEKAVDQEPGATLPTTQEVLEARADPTRGCCDAFRKGRGCDCIQQAVRRDAVNPSPPEMPVRHNDPISVDKMLTAESMCLHDWRWLSGEDASNVKCSACGLVAPLDDENISKDS